MKQNGLYNRIYAVVKQIPKGSVATYGQVASLAGIKGHARVVGYALNVLPAGTDIPWQRVVNAKRKVSERAIPGSENHQRHLLEAEEVKFDKNGRISFEKFLWKQEGSRSL